MQIVKNTEEIQRICKDLADGRKSIALVPTMGALHDGHASLIRMAQSDNDVVIVSIFVNPTQFAPDEDYSRYPRSFDQDCRVAANEGADVVFSPTVEGMFPDSFQSWVIPGSIAERLEGASRPGHFRGVATVVLKLLMLTLPTRAYFGLKDFQQLRVIQTMAKDFNLPVQIKAVRTVRESDGLALSSRNEYLSPAERQAALCLFRGLNSAHNAWIEGEREPRALKELVQECVEREVLARIDYIEVVDPTNLETATSSQHSCLIVLAVFIGKTRLIDNIVLTD